ncbi:ABC transporter permease [Paraburkholderia unamae]|uniref:ABC transporter permease n=1 Tax=Paraburkholderia unamae TaxID=219649 RepID=A0ACC6RXE1_9BURK
MPLRHRAGCPARGDRFIVATVTVLACSTANGSVFGVNNLIWLLVVVYALGGALLNHTRFGAAIFAIGGNEEAARMLGVRVERVKILAYGLSGALAGLSGALLASHLDAGLSGAGTGYELQSIAAAVIGGVLLTGGVGTMAGPLAGVLLLGVIDNVINQVGTLSPYYQNLASGAFLLAAVIVQTVLTGRRHGATRAAAGATRRRAAPGSWRSRAARLRTRLADGVPIDAKRSASRASSHRSAR